MRPADRLLVSAQDTSSKDTLITAQKAIVMPVLENFPPNERVAVTDLAINSVRTTKDNIVFNKNDFSVQLENIRKHEWVWHKKFTLSFACLILFFIGAPMGAIIRKGGLGLPVVISVLFFVAYHITSITGEKAAKVGDLSMFTGVWLSSMVLLPVGLFLAFKATTDASLLDTDSWRKFFNRMKNRIGSKKQAA
jgi:lipopolysaccharide export system permease protein